MDDNKEFQQIYASLLDGFNQAKQQNPDLDVDAYIMEYLSKNSVDDAKEQVKESLDFITDLDRNTAQVMEDTKYERLDDWFQKNVVEQVADPKEREELEQGLRKASEEIIQQSFDEIK